MILGKMMLERPFVDDRGEDFAKLIHCSGLLGGVELLEWVCLSCKN